MTDCTFCRIVAGELRCWKTYEDDAVLAFLDINPIAEGHTLVIPKLHFVNLYDIPEDLLGRVVAVSRRLALAYRETLGAQAANLLHSAGRAARQDVFHFHLHIIPRHENDGLHLGYRPRSGSHDFDAVLAKIRREGTAKNAKNAKGNWGSNPEWNHK
jgi:histidine triad (HIT) family protein